MNTLKGLLSSWYAVPVLLVIALLTSSGILWIPAVIAVVIIVGKKLLAKFSSSSTATSASVDRGSFAGRFIGGIFVAILLHLGFSFLFGVSVKEILTMGSLPSMLRDPANALTTAAFYEVVTIVFCFCGYYLWFSSPKRNRWLYKLVMVGCVIFMVAIKLYPVPEDASHTRMDQALAHFKETYWFSTAGKFAEESDKNIKETLVRGLDIAEPDKWVVDADAKKWWPKRADDNGLSEAPVLPYDLEGRALKVGGMEMILVTDEKYFFSEETIVYTHLDEAMQHKGTKMMFVLISLKDGTSYYVAWTEMRKYDPEQEESDPESVRRNNNTSRLAVNRQPEVPRSLESDVVWVNPQDNEWAITGVRPKLHEYYQIGILDQSNQFVGFDEPASVEQIIIQVGERDFKALNSYVLRSEKHVGQIHMLPEHIDDPGAQIKFKWTGEKRIEIAVRKVTERVQFAMHRSGD